MGKEVFYRQCHLKKKLKDGCYEEQTSYIPEPYCAVGRVLKLKENGVWDDGWVVTFASEHKHSDQTVNERSRDHTRNRRASDI